MHLNCSFVICLSDTVVSLIDTTEVSHWVSDWSCITSLSANSLGSLSVNSHISISKYIIEFQSFVRCTTFFQEINVRFSRDLHFRTPSIQLFRMLVFFLDNY